jgi:hypothetical protein
MKTAPAIQNVGIYASTLESLCFVASFLRLDDKVLCIQVSANSMTFTVVSSSALCVMTAFYLFLEVC